STRRPTREGQGCDAAVAPRRSEAPVGIRRSVRTVEAEGHPGRSHPDALEIDAEPGEDGVGAEDVLEVDRAGGQAPGDGVAGEAREGHLADIDRATLDAQPRRP